MIRNFLRGMRYLIFDAPYYEAKNVYDSYVCVILTTVCAITAYGLAIEASMWAITKLWWEYSFSTLPLILSTMWVSLVPLVLATILTLSIFTASAPTIRGFNFRISLPEDSKDPEESV